MHPARPKARHRQGGKRARPCRVLVFFKYFSPAHIRSGQHFLYNLLNQSLLLHNCLLQIFTTKLVTANGLLQLVTTGHCTMICTYTVGKIEANLWCILLYLEFTNKPLVDLGSGQVRKKEAIFWHILTKLEFTIRQLVTILKSAYIEPGQWKPLFDATFFTEVYFYTTDYLIIYYTTC